MKKYAQTSASALARLIPKVLDDVFDLSVNSGSTKSPLILADDSSPS